MKNPALNSLKGYDDQAETTYKVVVHTRTGSTNHEFHPVMEGSISPARSRPHGPSAGLVLLDHKAWLAAREQLMKDEDKFDELTINMPPPDEMTAEEDDFWNKVIRERIEEATGLKEPRSNSVAFKSLDEAINAANHLVQDIQEYHLVISGEQGKLWGLCYERVRRPKYQRAEDGELNPTGEYFEEVIYEQGH